jgi:cyclic beta-1,2-glucan synthetase
MQRASIEHVLGVRIRNDFIEIDPCIPDHWPGFEVRLRHAGCHYEISVLNPHGVSGGIVAAEVDGVALPTGGAEFPADRVRIACRHDAAACVIGIILGTPQKH